MFAVMLTALPTPRQSVCGRTHIGKLRVLQHADKIGNVGKACRYARLSEWEQFYNLSRPHGAFNGKAPYEVLRERL
jgi:hypothetical protein